MGRAMDRWAVAVSAGARRRVGTLVLPGRQRLAGPGATGHACSLRTLRSDSASESQSCQQMLRALQVLAWKLPFGCLTLDDGWSASGLGAAARDHTGKGRKGHMETHLTEEQIKRLLAALRGHPLEAIITLALVTGVRRDELLSLKWQDLDLEKREVRVLNSKTKRGSRLLHVPQEVIKILKQHQLRQMQARLAAGPVWQNLDLVFPDRTGGLLGPDQLVQGFYGLLAQAGLPPLRFHELRAARGRVLRERVRTAKEERDGIPGEDLDRDKNTNQ